MSEYGGAIPDAWWRELRDRHGVNGAVIQCWGGGSDAARANRHFQRQLQGALAAGLRVAAYCWPPADWRAALDHASAGGGSAFGGGTAVERLAFFALDVEAGAPVAPEHVRGVRDAGLRPVIYTSPAAWAAIMGNTRSFSDLPLWLARYPRDLPPEAPVAWEDDLATAFGSYRAGGWSAAAGWQFRGTTQLGAAQADLSIFAPSAFEREAPLTPEHVLAVSNERQFEARLVDRWAGALHAAAGYLRMRRPLPPELRRIIRDEVLGD